MISLIEGKRPALQRLCVRRRVRLLEVFGSAAGDTFDPAKSDLDFLVEFQSMSPVEHADALFGLQEDLERLFDRPVDLLEREPIRNPYLLQSIDQTKALLYAAA